MAQETFMDAENTKKLTSKVFDFRKILKIHEKIVNPQDLLLFFNRRENAEKLSNN